MNLNVIPQIFYDIIVRLIPGTLILLLATVSWVGVETISSNYGSYIKITSQINWFGGVVLLMLAYFISSFFNEFYNQAIRLYSMFRQKPASKGGKTDTDTTVIDVGAQQHKALRRALKNDPADRGWTSEGFPNIMVLHNYLRISRPDEAGRMMKIHAEATFAKTMASSQCFLAGIQLILTISSTAHRSWLDFFYFLFLATGSYLFSRRSKKLRHYFDNGTLGAFFVDAFLHSPNKQAETSGQEEPEQLPPSA